MFSSSQLTLGSDGRAAATSLFTAQPINPELEMSAYESLWLGESAWFASLARLFRESPDRLPSELVPRHEVEQTWEQLSGCLGDYRRQIGIRIHGALDYPQRLREAENPLELIYFRGDWSLADSPSVAVVGTRNPSEEGERNARRIATALVKAGFTVVSGLAKGIDSAAHRAAIEAGGKTIAVIGTPLTESYPKENAGLQELIAREHLLISQVPFLRYKRQAFKTRRLFFPARNITMSALTRATIIVEAGDTSGTLVQARAALKQGRLLFILDPCFRQAGLRWPAKYEAMGAIRVRTVKDIVERLKGGSEGEADPDQ